MDDRKITNHYYFGDLGFVAWLLIFSGGLGLVILILAASRGIIAAIVILTGLIVTGLIILGIILALVVQAQTTKQAAKRAVIEHAQIRANTDENLALLEQQFKVQYMAGRAQNENIRALRSEVATYRGLPAPADEAGGFVFDEDLYDQLEIDR